MKTTASITITLEKARKWYNGDNAELKKLALQAFNVVDLEFKYETIKTLPDVAKALGLNWDSVCDTMMLLGGHLAHVYKLDLIRKALNGDWKPSLITGNVYYPYVRFYLANEARAKTKENSWVVKESFIADGKKYTLVGGDYYCYGCAGLGNFGSRYGGVLTNLGLLGCKSEEVARHMSKYFSKEIFEASYMHHCNYEWV